MRDWKNPGIVMSCQTVLWLLSTRLLASAILMAMLFYTANIYQKLSIQLGITIWFKINVDRSLSLNGSIDFPEISFILYLYRYVTVVRAKL